MSTAIPAESKIMCGRKYCADADYHRLEKKTALSLNGASINKKDAICLSISVCVSSLSLISCSGQRQLPPGDLSRA